MESITSFLRRKGYAAREIMELVRQLRPNGRYADLEVGAEGTIEEILQAFQREPLAAELLRTRESLESMGITPVQEFDHTLKVPVPARGEIPAVDLYFARVSKSRWIYFKESGSAFDTTLPARPQPG